MHGVDGGVKLGLEVHHPQRVERVDQRRTPAAEGVFRLAGHRTNFVVKPSVGFIGFPGAEEGFPDGIAALKADTFVGW